MPCQTATRCLATPAAGPDLVGPFEDLVIRLSSYGQAARTAHPSGEPLLAVVPALASPGPGPLRHAVPFPKRQPSCRSTWCGNGDLWACWSSLAEAVNYDMAV